MATEGSRRRDRRSIVTRFFDSRGPSHGRDPDQFDPATIGRVMKRVERLYGPGRYFGLDFAGWEQVPPSPVLVVANHSGGTTIPDAWGLVYSWYLHHGVHARPLHAMAHDLVFALPAVGEPFARCGLLRADRDLAVRVLRDHRHDLLVFPGGDVETWRPYRDRYRVRWAGRKGYARIALQAGVPIVPVACAGAHDTLVVLTDGQKLGRALQLHRFARSSIFPIHLSLPWGLGIGPLPHLPTPTTLRYRIGPPILPPPDLPSGEEPSREVVADHDRRVREAVQLLLDELSQEPRL